MPPVMVPVAVLGRTLEVARKRDNIFGGIIGGEVGTQDQKDGPGNGPKPFRG